MQAEIPDKLDNQVCKITKNNKVCGPLDNGGSLYVRIIRKVRLSFGWEGFTTLFIKITKTNVSGEISLIKKFYSKYFMK